MKPIVTVAVAEDHTLVRSGLIKIINSFPNFTVIAEGANGNDLVRNLALIDTEVNICILDINMPEMNGYDTLTTVRKIYPSMKFLVVTMLEKEYSIIRMIKSGANGYLLKGCSTEELLTALKQIHTNGYYYSQVASERAFSVIHNNPVLKLTQKELEFLRYSCSDLTYAEIAKKMFLSPRTIEDYHKKIAKKLNIHTRIDLVLFALQTGLVSLNDVTSSRADSGNT